MNKNIIIDKFIKGTLEFDNIYNAMFCTYFPSFTMDLIRHDHYTETWKINDMHKVICRIWNNEIHEIEVQKHYYYYYHD